jgi:hypothetical protein
LGFWIPLRAWRSLSWEYCVLSDSGFSVGLITRLGKPFRVCCVWVIHRSSVKRKAINRMLAGSLRKRKKKYITERWTWNNLSSSWYLGTYEFYNLKSTVVQQIQLPSLFHMCQCGFDSMYKCGGEVEWGGFLNLLKICK